MVSLSLVKGGNQETLQITNKSYLATVTCTSSNTKVATVSNKGVITSKNVTGTAIITVKVSQYGGRTDTISIPVSVTGRLDQTVSSSKGTYSLKVKCSIAKTSKYEAKTVYRTYAIKIT